MKPITLAALAVVLLLAGVLASVGDDRIDAPGIRHGVSGV